MCIAYHCREGIHQKLGTGLWIRSQSLSAEKRKRYPLARRASKAEGLTGEAEPGKGGPSAPPEPPGKLLSSRVGLVARGRHLSEAGAGQRPSPLGQPDQFPTAMRSGVPAPKSKEPPFGGEKDTEFPDLESLEQVEAMEHYVADQKRKLEGKKKPKKGGISPVPYLEEAKEIRKIIDAFRGQARYRDPSSPPMPSDLKGVLF